jgi:zinc transporter ZupT
MPASRAFLFGQLSGVVEPVGGVLGAALVLVVTPVLPYALAFAAGAMIYVVVDQLIPESLEGAHSTTGNKQQTLSFLFGFGLMMTLDVALG